MPRSHPRYAPEFRAEAVRLVREGGRTPRQLAADLGCSESSINGWLKQADVDAGRRSDGLTSAEREELRQLRAENRVLRMERDLLKELRRQTWLEQGRLQLREIGIGLAAEPELRAPGFMARVYLGPELPPLGAVPWP